MVHHGFTDPLKPPSVASRSAAAVAVILGGNGNGSAGGGGGGAGGVSGASLPSVPSPPRPSSPLFAAVLLRATGVQPLLDGSAPAVAAGVAAVTTAAGAADASATAAAACRVVASACTALHGLLRSGSTTGSGGSGDRGYHTGTGNERRRGDSTTADAAVAAARALAPCLEAFLSVCWSKSKATASSRLLRPAPSRGGEGGAAAPAGSGENGALETEREREREMGGAEEARREAYQATSSLLDFVDGVALEVDTPAPLDRFDHSRRRQAGGDVRQRLSADRRSGKQPPSPPGRRAGRMWAEVRGLCRREKEARVAASRRLAGMLKGSAATEVSVEGEGGGRGGRGGGVRQRREWRCSLSA